MELLNNFLLTLICAATIFSCSAMITHPYERSENDQRLIRASSMGHLSRVQRAIAQGASNSAKNVACRCAAQLGHLDVVQLLVNSGADIHDDNDYAVQLAADHRYWDIVAYLLQQGANRAVLSFDQIISLIKSGAIEFIPIELQISLNKDDWYQVEKLLIAASEHEWPTPIQQEIKNLLVPAVQKKFNSMRSMLPPTTMTLDVFLRTFSFIIGPHTAAVFKNLKK